MGAASQPASPSLYIYIYIHTYIHTYIHKHTHILYVSGGVNSLPKIHADLQACISFLRCTWRSSKESPRVYWGATLSCPFMASNDANSYLVLISFRSRSDVVLDADHALDVLSYLVFLQTCILFCSVSDKSGACSCLVHIKCRYSYVSAM